MERYYQFDPDLRIWERIGATPLPYSDGDEIESRLLSILRNAINVSSSSPEISAAIQDWPSEYHFSPVRHNLLRPFRFKPTDHILELGCGCGSITRYLGESGATVVSVEGSQRRAKIAAERCRDLPNVSIYRDNIAEFESADKFDYVTLIGVLEYAPKFIGSEDPVGTCLKHARSFLKDDGALILAIENQLGLKYFNGCSEDHIGIPYFGVNGLYGKDDPVTFGRHVLAEKLNQSGFPVQEFFYPFPDYKLPGLILSEAALRDGRLNVADLLIHNTGRNYPETHHRAFAEDLAWQVVVENGLLSDLANSILVVSRLTGAATGQTNWLAKMYNRGQRRPCYQVESTIEENGDDHLVVRKRMLYPDEPVENEWLGHVVRDSDYITGSLLIGNIHKAMAREAGIEELAVCFAPWIGFLRANASKNEKGELVLPGKFVDCIPVNMVEGQNGVLNYFDEEWVCSETIPLAWVLVRGICGSLSGCMENRHLTEETFRTVIVNVVQRAAIHLTDNDFSVADDCETRLISCCFVGNGKSVRMIDVLDGRISMWHRLSCSIQALERAEAEIMRMKNTISWRVTIPLRVVWNQLCRLIGIHESSRKSK